MVLRAGDLIEWEWDYNSHKSLFILLEDVESAATSGESRARTGSFRAYLMNDVAVSPRLPFLEEKRVVDYLTYDAFNAALRKNKIRKLIDVKLLTQTTMEKNHD
tara:strand:+ start:1146 stop:1457 length:312 start_codon:yes stop_codon:yes gene_type:complete